ncbi:uncharacterized protein LOC124157816 [Ischnura elegans]|uniref:uncharacterized protein LOC124157816 n=1 Tax=Ischnura elegans TaxID=197161 RepID=UPI001ED88822|nr:uncharacterized protein LOC124157816 [Ischnura elegans]
MTTSRGDSDRAEADFHGAHYDPYLEEEEEEEAVWVFGYGSLCWFPGFEYKESVLGYVTGFKRRFWQGNATHRGTANRPGRVATVVEDEKEVVWGRAFLVTGDAALPYLSQRECKLGGYATKNVLFYPHQPNGTKSTPSTTGSATTTTSGGNHRDAPTKEDLFAQNLLASLRLEESSRKTSGCFCPDMKHRPSFANASPFSIATKYFCPSPDSGYSSPGSHHPDRQRKSKPFTVLMYVAQEDNRYWMGKAPLQTIADQISECHGPSGSNADYLLNLARFMRTEFPTARDDHLFVLERLVRERLTARGQMALVEEAAAGREEAAGASPHQFTARLPSKKLRCLNI